MSTQETNDNDARYLQAAEQLDGLLKDLSLSDAVSLLQGTLANIYTKHQKSKATFLKDCGNAFDELSKGRVVSKGRNE